MITTELRNIEGRLTSNHKMNTGLEFMRLIREEGLLEVSTGIFPAICGGAVRDCLFTGNEINDIDIFFFRDSRSPSFDRSGPSASTSGLVTALTNFRNDVLAWLEDQDIESESLLSQRAEDYFGGQRFIDIIQFTWRDTTIQLMIPMANQLNSSIDYLLRTMPLYSGMAVTMEQFRAFDTTIANMFLPRGCYFVATDRDVPYLRHKTEGQAGVRYIPVTSNREAVGLALHQFQADIPLPTRRNELSMNDLQINSATNLARRATASAFGISAESVTTAGRDTHRL